MKKELRSIRLILAVFILLLVLSGLTAFPLRSEMSFLNRHLPLFPPLLRHWIREVSTAVNATPDIVLYGTDWLAFAHLVIAVFFAGAFIDPVRNKFIILTGLIACAAVFPLAFIMGPVRGIPFFHQLIDCSFGFFGGLILLVIYKKINRLDHEIKSAL